ncbi:hypothetical protein [Tuwongella immobilis]|nr:hypothetical protein [Tuwongella immobilis]
MGIALPWNELPLSLIEANQLTGRIHERGGEKEIRFLVRHYPRILPIWLDGQIQLARWGSTRRDSRQLPPTAWTWQESIDSGKWSGFNAQLVDIPANFGFDKGVWFRIRQGIRGLYVRDEFNQGTVYMICEPASRYYRIMTRSDRMPTLIDEII